jgi:hypothetical protein
MAHNIIGMLGPYFVERAVDVESLLWPGNNWQQDHGALRGYEVYVVDILLPVSQHRWLNRDCCVRMELYGPMDRGYRRIQRGGCGLCDACLSVARAVLVLEGELEQ